MNKIDLIILALNKIINKKVQEGAYGLILIGIPEIPIKQLLLSFEEPEKTNVSLIGYTESKNDIMDWAYSNGWDNERLGFNTTHAVSVRNREDTLENSKKLAFVWEEEERLGSLVERGYQYIGPTELIEQICLMGSEDADNIPQKNLWFALGSEKVSAYITLDGIIDYYLSLFTSENQDVTSINKPRKNLVLLNFLPDNELLTKKFNDVKQIVKRLIQNAEMVERIQRADEEDRQKALKTLKVNSELKEEKNKLQRVYNAYLRLTRSDYTALSVMELSDAIFLLSGKRKIVNNNPSTGGEDFLPEGNSNPEGGDDFLSEGNSNPEGGDDFLSEGNSNPEGGDDFLPEGNSNPEDGGDFRGDYNPEASQGINTNKNRYENFAIAAIKLTRDNESLALTKLVDEAKRLLVEGEYDKKLIRVNSGRLVVEATFNPIETAISINKNFTKNGRLGGKVNAEDTELESVIGNFGGYIDRSEFTDEVSVRTLLDFMRKAKLLIEDFNGENLLSEYVNARSLLYEYADLLAISPLACLLSYSEARENAAKFIFTYERLLEHLDTHYSKLHRQSPEGVEFIYKEILALDTIKIFSENEVSVLLTALNPLVIWKYIEIANIVLSESETLPLEDTELLSKEINNLPEPLLAVYSSGDNENYEKLGFSSRIGSLPLYRSISIEISDLSQRSLGTAAIKLGSLYAPVKENLRILLVDPISTKPTSSTIKDLINRYGFKKVTMIVVKTGKQKTGTELPFDSNLKELVYENKVDIEVLRIRSIDQLNKYLLKKPVHILGISGEKTKNVSLIESEGTKLHPLSVPHKIHSDPLMETITLKPRSVKSTEDGIKHPFSIYHKIVSEVTGNYHSEFSMQEARSTPLNEIASILPLSQFVITIGQIPEIIDDPDLIRLTQNVEISGDTVYTYHKNSIISRLSKQLKKFNYRPTLNGVMTLLKRLQVVGGEGIFSIITEKGKDGLSETGVKGLLGLAVALNWYVNRSYNERNIVVSLDSYLARRWLNKRIDNKRSDFLGIRQLNDGSYSIDILEVKGYEATNDIDVLESHAAQQLKSVAQLMHNMVKRQGDLFTDRRRELLRLQIFREALQLSNRHEPEWIRTLNSIIDGKQEVKINLVLLEVAFDQNIEVSERVYTPETIGEESEVYHLPIKRIRLGESEVQRYLVDYVEKLEESEPSIEQGRVDTDNNTLNLLEANHYQDVNNGNGESEAFGFVESNNRRYDNKTVQNCNQIVIGEEENKPNTFNCKNINSEIRLLLGTQIGWNKDIYWDHRRAISSPLANHNIIITGDPGKGKTQTIKGLIHELRENNIPLLTFDFKDDYIEPEFLERENIVRFDIMAEGLPFNPLVPSIDPIENTFIAIKHIVQIEGILKRVYNLGIQQATQLRKAIIEVFKEKGINTNIPTKLSEVKAFPTFDDVRKLLYEDERRNSTLIGRLDLLFQIGIFPNKPTINFDQLMNGSYTLRLSTLPDPDNEIKAAVAEMIILAVHNYLISKEHPRKLTRAIVLDEAHRVSNSKALLGLMREGRAFGLGMLIATQFPTDIPQDIYGCTETKLFLGNDDFVHAESVAKKLEGGASRHDIKSLAEQIRNMNQFRAVLRNSQHPKVFVELVPYYKKI